MGRTDGDNLFLYVFLVQKQLFLSDSPLPRVLHALLFLLFSDNPLLDYILFLVLHVLVSTVATICTISNDSMNLAMIFFGLRCVLALYIFGLV